MEASNNTPRYQTIEDELALFSALDLYKALHWTAKTDLCQALDLDYSDSNDNWTQLVTADRSLRKFMDFELLKIIEYYKSNIEPGGN